MVAALASPQYVGRLVFKKFISEVDIEHSEKTGDRRLNDFVGADQAVVKHSRANVPRTFNQFDVRAGCRKSREAPLVTR
jgi:hypothetical protein